MHRDAGRGSGALVMAVGGGLLFVASLLYFASSYFGRYGAPAPAGASIAGPLSIDVALFTVFALHHSLLAREACKRVVRRILPPALERSLYVWTASVLFAGVCAAWQHVPGEAWSVSGWTATALRALQFAGVGLVAATAARLDVLDLAGLRQVLRARGTASAPQALDAGGPYRFVRHPIYLGWLLIVWPISAMTGTRLAFAAVSTLYLLVAMVFEERDLVRTFGAGYERYRRRVRWRLLPGVH